LQIAVKNGVVQKWGLVEFKTAEDAEAVLTSGLQLRGQPIRKLLHNPHTVLCPLILCSLGSGLLECFFFI
jgi:hypothetical protein